MKSPLFNALGNQYSGGNGPMDIMSQLQKFRQEMQGKNPNEEINRLLQSGQVSQQQLDQAQQMARQLMGMFGNNK